MKKTLVIRVVSAALLAALTGSSFGQTVIVERVSVSSTGEQGNAASWETPSVSGSGRFVAFGSSASNLVPGDTNGVNDVFIFDRATRTTQRVSVSSLGVQANGHSGMATISNDGRFVAFYSAANNLMSNDTNGSDDLFIHDRQTGQTRRVSESAASEGANSGVSYWSALCLSPDGRYAVFSSGSTNLVPGDTNGQSDIFLKDLESNAIEIISIPHLGGLSNGPSVRPNMSADGRFVVFESNATNLVGGVTSPYRGYLRDRLLGTTECVTRSWNGGEANFFCHNPVISADGRFVTFHTSATNIVQPATNGTPYQFIHDRQLNTNWMYCVNGDGERANGGCIGGNMSADGTKVVYYSEATNLADNDTNGTFDVFQYDFLTGETRRISESELGVPGNEESSGAMVSADGTTVVFCSKTNNLVTGDTNGVGDMFAVQTNANIVVPISYVIIQGSEFTGGLARLRNSDDSCLAVFNDEDSLAAQIQFNGRTTKNQPSSYIFECETSVSRPGLQFSVEVRSYAANRWAFVHGSTASMVDVSLDIDLSSSVAQFVGNTGNVSARLNWSPINDEDPSMDGWLHRIDRLYWNIH